MPVDPNLGDIAIWSSNFAPRGWAKCEGQLTSISQNSALFSVIGTFYGGDGRTTFALPDLRGRVPVGAGQGPGLARYDVGDSGGVVSVPLEQFQVAPALADPATEFSAFPGSTTSVPVAQPYLVVTYIIALVGLFPSRS